MSNLKQRTIAGEASFSGIGLHSGERVRIKFKPAPPNSGIRFVRIDLEANPEIKADVTNTHTDSLSRRTVITSENTSVSTVEHVMAAIFGLGIDNLLIEIDGAELPESDGSCLPFVELLRKAGIVELDQGKQFVEVDSPISVSSDGAQLIALPYPGFRITFTISFDHPLIGAQHASYEITEEIFEKEIAPARTFAFLKEVEALRDRGLAKGGSLANSIVVGDDRLVNPEPLRFRDEFVRHKILDLIGDLGLVGFPIRGHIIALKSGHTLNIELVKKIRQMGKPENTPMVGKHLREVPSSLSITEIQDMMPHRYPFLLVDRIIELEKGKKVVGIKNVTINEPFFVGHFPGHPIMPAVLIIEAMAQVGGVLLLSMVDEPKSKLVYFMAIDKAKFRRPVFPGDQIRFELEMLKLKLNTCKMKGLAFVDGNLVAEAELLSIVMDREEIKRRGLMK
ncbi:MAG: bifunctional UDP-3-O-[3-hydroxymyristoyl] N-acetylglucosamine deacetylase/3-hydroxyacyl-ACP dehydratase [bacterium]